MGFELFHANGRMDMKPIVAFCNFEKEPKKKNNRDEALVPQAVAACGTRTKDCGFEHCGKQCGKLQGKL